MIVDMNESVARDAKEKLAFEAYSTDWHDIINDPEISVVDICTPNNVHAEIAIAAAKAGKHIICEKPLALTSDEAKEMYLTAKKNHVKTMVAFNYRKTPAVQLAKKYIDEGAIGEILDFRGTYLQDWSADPDSPLSWRFQKDICGSGALGDIGTHVVDMLRFLVGDFKRVNARTATYIKERPLQTGMSDSLGTRVWNRILLKKRWTWMISAYLWWNAQTALLEASKLPETPGEEITISLLRSTGQRGPFSLTTNAVMSFRSALPAMLQTDGDSARYTQVQTILMEADCGPSPPWASGTLKQRSLNVMISSALYRRIQNPFPISVTGMLLN